MLCEIHPRQQTVQARLIGFDGLPGRRSQVGGDLQAFHRVARVAQRLFGFGSVFLRT
jgi:hypothetical protein